MLSSTRPIIWKFINCLKKEESLTKITSEQLLAGYVPNNKKKIIMIYPIDTLKVCLNLDNHPIDEILFGIIFFYFGYSKFCSCINILIYYV